MPDSGGDGKPRPAGDRGGAYPPGKAVPGRTPHREPPTRASTAALLAAPTGLAPASVEATPFSATCRKTGSTPRCSANVRVVRFAKLPDKKHLEVRHLSCELIGDETRTTDLVRARVDAGPDRDGICQPLVLAAQTAAKKYWNVDGNVGFLVPPGESFDILHGGSGTGTTRADRVVSGALVTNPRDGRAGALPKPAGLAYMWSCRGNPDMAINWLRNKPIGPGGGTRRLHPSPRATRVPAGAK